MKKRLFNFIVAVSTLSIVNAQTFTGKLGYGISPAGFPVTYSQLGAFFTEVANTCGGGIVLGNGSWRDSLNGSGNIPGLAKLLCANQPSPFGYTDMLVLGWATYPTLYLDAPGYPTNNWSNANTKALFLKTIKSTADSLHPTYLFIGNEVNFYWQQDSVDFVNWSTFYSQAYDTIKKYSPITKVGTVFNYEGVSGQGVLAGMNKQYWNALKAMDTSKMDVVGFTIYPFLNSTTANTVPSTYLDALFNHIGNKPVCITETGWPADSTQAGALWATTPTEQVNYVNKIFSLISGRNVESVNWLYLNYLMMNDPSVNIFKSVCMRDSLGNDRPALPLWLSKCASSGITDDLTETGLSVYPNPTEDRITVSFETLPDETTLVVCDMIGNSVLRMNVKDNNTTVDLSALSKGVYFLTIHSGGKTITKKLIRS